MHACECNVVRACVCVCVCVRVCVYAYMRMRVVSVCILYGCVCELHMCTAYP